MDEATYRLFAAGAAIIAALGFLYTIYKGQVEIGRSRAANARTAWESYLKMAFDNPRLARADVKEGDLDEFEKYEWFVSRLLYAAEEVLLFAPDNETWHGAISAQAGFHSNYLKSAGGRYLKHYSPKVRELVKAGLRNA